jgi:meiotically up-regulated gene 157 (Mug157) protein
MIELSQAMKDHIAEYSAKLAKYPKLQKLYENCYPNTLLTTAERLEDGSVFLYTGDIPAMWLRDSTAQVTQYISVAKEDKYTADIIKGLLRRQFEYINVDPYANAFNIEPNGEGHVDDHTEMQPIVYERKYEIDSLCYPMRLAFLYYEATDDTSIFDDLFISTAKKIVSLWRTEQRHMEESTYRFSRDDCPWHDTIHNRGMGFPVNYTGMTWSGFRPSDDGCVFGYLVPSNLFAVVILSKLRKLFKDVIPDPEFSQECRELASEIKRGVDIYATVDHPKYGKIYACETDGFGNHRLFDDANVPSLLSLPYLGYCEATSEIYANTRRFILSKDNPYYFEGKCGKGIGSPHTGDNRVWHIALSMQGLTSVDEKEMLEILDMLVNTDGGTGYMHESFNVDDDKLFSRAWFAWSNSLFAEFVEKVVDLGLIG